ncbi:class I SAM-dependent methyltransferase [Pedobacter montanisoli]|uniref:Class I SAM-dependent methyltransferase n=1 Tax=Pedobacter montanisoli TaxID=2923277 RepID=A0ABS9ZXH8_9SPHI|nr:class I SAM-dependent methyltransferase [Pedobacter montanisoli]MCJ0742995.1 class I SAM-dependent methyltransferase [Pedobacter montanisoli]
MELNRKPLQGVLNIICFNSHFYLMAVIIFIVLIVCKNQFSPHIQNLLIISSTIAIFTIIISLLVSFYIYDLSDLYLLGWVKNADYKKILNINAGFDETSEIISNKFPNANLTICDFYNPVKHTEKSIKRARKLYPPNPQTIFVETKQLIFQKNTFDKSLVILSAHEIRNKNERVQFFKELNRVTKPVGQILVTEHLRDWKNFLAYTIGFFHFYSRKSWLQTFNQAGLIVKQEIKTTPFITTFILEKNENTF